MKRPELLAPAGSMSMLRAAIDAGADAVYLGLNQYNARIHATNFTMESLPEALEYAHLRNSKVYITLNTLIDDDEMMDAVELAIEAYKLGADAFLVQDIGLASYLATHFPDIPIHASTQMNVFSKEHVPQMRDFKVERVVLPRELSLDEIRSRADMWHNENIEVEVFVHGAMCVCYSGLCLFSSMNKSGSRSGNRGACAQPCRQSYQIYDGNREVEVSGKPLREGKLLSPKDQSALPYLRELVKAGVDSLKIEGRMRDENYCMAVVSAYRRMLDAILDGADTKEVMQEIQNDLLVTFNRGGAFTTQYMQGKKGSDYLSGEYAGKYGLYWGEILSLNAKMGTICVRSWQADVPQKGDFLSIRDKETEIASFPVGKIEISMNSALVKGLHPDAIAKLHQGMAVYRMSKKIEVSKDALRRTPVAGTLFCSDGVYSLKMQVAEGAFAGVETTYTLKEEAMEEGAPLSWERAKEQLSKTGQTPFHFVSLDMDGDFPILLRISQINSMRRDALEQLASVILEYSRKDRDPQYVETEEETPEMTAPEQQSLVVADYLDLNRITDGYACGADIYVFPALGVTRSGRITWIDELLAQEPDAKIALRLPGAYKDDMTSVLEKAYKLVSDHAGRRFLGFFGTVKTGKTVGLLPGANIYNHFAYSYAAAKAPAFVFPSHELTEEQLVKMAGSAESYVKSTYLAVHRYGPIEWMQSEFCPLGQHQKNCTMCQEHPEVSLGEKMSPQSGLHNDSRVDIVCYPGFCRTELFGQAKNPVSGDTVRTLLNMGIPVASVVRFMGEDQMERRAIVESLADIEDPDLDEEEWYEY